MCLRDNCYCSECSKLYRIEEERNKVDQEKRVLMRRRLNQLREKRRNKNK